MSLAAYEDARPWAKAIKEEVLTRRMPKWHAARGYGDFSNDPSLSPFEIALIAAWADGGAPKGTDAEAREGTADVVDSRRAAQNPDAPTVSVPCGDQPLPAGVLLAIRPQIEARASIGMSVSLPDGRREILGYIRGFEPDFATTYWLRAPLDLPPGSRVVTELTSAQQGSTIACSLALTIQERR